MLDVNVLQPVTATLSYSDLAALDAELRAHLSAMYASQTSLSLAPSPHEELSFDIVVKTSGVTPDTEWAKPVGPLAGGTISPGEKDRDNSDEQTTALPLRDEDLTVTETARIASRWVFHSTRDSPFASQ